jgi:hypothetical protein
MKTKNYLTLSLLAALLSIAAPSAVRAEDSAAPKADASKSTAELIGDLKKSAETAADPELKTLGKQLATKTEGLNTALEGNTAAQSQLQSALAGLTGKGSPASTVSALQQLSQAKLTTEQTKLAKDVYNTGSAYLIQKNLGNLEGSQSDVAQVVSAVKNGSPVEALPALKNIGQNAKLTDGQKTFVQSLVKNYVPGLQKAGDLINSIPGFGK